LGKERATLRVGAWTLEVNKNPRYLHDFRLNRKADSSLLLVVPS
jgi:hypothetical protein